MHTPVLLQLAVQGLNIQENGLYIDATAGEGGHLGEIAKNKVRVLALDWDKDQINNLKQKLNTQKNIVFAQGNFAQIEKIAQENNFFPVEGVIFDFGLSYRQIKHSGRGFSFQADEESLDMRLDLKEDVTAADLLNKLGEKELYTIFARYSEDVNSQIIAHEIVRQRRQQKIIRVRELKQAIDLALGRSNDKATYARIFQALRIAVNHELENIQSGLAAALKILKPGGRIVVITFHSLEDRLVKKFILSNKLLLINKKVQAGDQKLSFERSAKLRIITTQK